MFVPIPLIHRQPLDRTVVTHVRLLRRRADTDNAQRCLDHIVKLADKNGITEICKLLPGWPPERKGLGVEKDMWHCLRHYANERSAGSQHQNKGLIEIGYLEGGKTGPRSGSQDGEALRANLERGVARALSETQEVRRQHLATAPKYARLVQVTATAFLRNPYVVAEVLLRAAGVCEQCHEKAPFQRRSDGTPYLEVHHRVRLADRGEDTVENAIAVCPNCHRRAHYG